VFQRCCFISAGRCVRHHRKISHAIPAAEQTGVVPAPAPVVELDAPRAAVAALTADALPAARIDAPAAGLAANIAVAADCTAAQAVKAESPTHR
jgi:isocitrate lyase